MNKVKIKYCNFWGEFDPKNNLFYNILSKHYDVEISEDPDLVIASNLHDPFEWAKYKCTRLMFMGENISPDFTSFDYVIGCDDISFGDRYMRMPYAYFAYFSDHGVEHASKPITVDEARKILDEKKYFCNFIFNYESPHGMRKRLFDALNDYKQVISAGPYLNNTVELGISTNHYCKRREKFDIVKKSKFTIACDSISYPGFVTEKIVDSLENYSIPIYFGNPQIENDFNKDAFIRCSGEGDIERVVEEVKRLDNDDEAYMKMIMQCHFRNYNYMSEVYDKLEKFLVNIVEQPENKKIRRIRYYAADRYNDNLDEYRKYHLKIKKRRKISRKIRKIFRIKR